MGNLDTVNRGYIKDATDSSEVRAKIFHLQLFGKEPENPHILAKNWTNMELPQASKWRKQNPQNFFTKLFAVVEWEKFKCQKNSSRLFKLIIPTLCKAYFKRGANCLFEGSN